MQAHISSNLVVAALPFFNLEASAWHRFFSSLLLTHVAHHILLGLHQILLRRLLSRIQPHVSNVDLNPYVT
ncbi:hypothetical protein [Xanthomonas translucens]|uniref:hypothetical protein n=1 Tax=Xanthomonas campestris pv. translucens TaxID=343 RepID=UPI000B0ED80C|nr:hypothetical protein [Xanthomonas translucens]